MSRFCACLPVEPGIAGGWSEAGQFRIERPISPCHCEGMADLLLNVFSLLARLRNRWGEGIASGTAHVVAAVPAALLAARLTQLRCTQTRTAVCDNAPDLLDRSDTGDVGPVSANSLGQHSSR
jgi:hypothetical protein